MVLKKVKIDNKFIFDIRSLRMISGVYPCFLILLKFAVGGVWMYGMKLDWGMPHDQLLFYSPNEFMSKQQNGFAQADGFAMLSKTLDWRRGFSGKPIQAALSLW